MKRVIFKSFVFYLIASLLAYLSPVPYAYANPQGGKVSVGAATIEVHNNTETIHQKTANAIIDWDSFNIGGKETTRFVDPSRHSLTVNRVHDMDPSKILGTLTSNGNIVLINPNGVFFGKNSKVDVNGIIATTSKMKNSDQDFMTTGKLQFGHGGNPNARVENQGVITAAEAGLVGLVAPNVSNSGTITAKLGTVHLASGDQYTLDFYGDRLMEVKVSDDVKKQIVENSGTINAAGGTIALTAAAGRSIVNSLLDVKGELHAPAVAQKNGKIFIYAEGTNAVKENAAAKKGKKSGSSTVMVSGILDASGINPGEKGGNISVLGDNVEIMRGTILDASGDQGGGYIKIGGDYHGVGATPTAIDTFLDNGVSIRANAISHGNGGNVAVWSDDRTDFLGNIEARGGPNGGNGGFVETSGKQTLNSTGIVVASAPMGLAGTWLMDPYNVTIGNADDGNGFIDGSNPTADANISHTTIEAALNAGTNVTITTGGNGSPGANNGDITVNSAISATTGTGGVTGSLTLSAYRNIIVNAAITEGSPGTAIGGEVTLNADNGGNGSGYINIGAAITTNGGNITMGGGNAGITAGTLNADGTVNAAATGFAVGNAGQASGINIGADVNAGGGAIIMNGSGYTGGVNTNYAYGVYVNNNTVQISGTGTIAITGNGGGSGSGLINYGVYVGGSSAKVSGQNSNINIVGMGGNTTGSYNEGIGIDNGAIAETTGTGILTLSGTGRGSGGGGHNVGVSLSDGNHATGGTARSTGTNGGAIVINGTGGDNGGSGGNNYGVDIGGGSSTGSLVTSKDGNITITGHGVATNSVGGNIGIAVDSKGVVSSTGNATITLTGTGGGTGNSTSNYGVYITGANSGITSATGAISITGTGGNSTTGKYNYGVEVDGGTIATGSNTLTVTGNGGGTGASHDDYGVYVTSTAGGTIESTGAGAVNVTGTGGDTGGSGGINYGVFVNVANGIQAASGSNITINGTGGASSGSRDIGVDVTIGSIVGGGNGTGVSITGISGDSTADSNEGVEISLSTISNTGNGTVTITGTGQGAGNSGSDYGVFLLNPGVVSTVDGLLTVTGTGGGAGTGTNNHGVYISSGSNSTIKTTGSGNIIVNGIAGNTGSGSSYGVNVNIANGLQTAGTGSITASADSFNLNQANDINSTGNATIRPHTPGTTVDVGGTSNGTLGLPDSLLSDITAGSITIGDRSNTGNMTVETADTFSAPITLLTAGGANLTLSHSLTDTASGNAIVLVSGNNFTNTAGSSGLSASNGRWLVYSTNPANDTIGGLANGFRRFSCTYGGSCPSFPGIGNGLLYSYTPTLTATPNAASTTYGSAVPGFAYTLSGYLGSDSGSDSVTGTPGYSTNYSQGNNVGTYNITATAGSLASALGYGFAGATLNNGLSVNAASLTVTADAKSKNYGAANPALTYQYSGLVNGDTSSVFSGGLTTPATASSNVGTYAINQGSLAAGGNYTISYTGANLTVNAASLSVTVDAKSKTYGSANPALTYQYSGLVNGDTSSVFSGGLTTPATASSNVGTYAINQGSLGAGSNYTISYTGANLTVNAASLTVTADAKSKTYGAANPGLTYQYSGLVNGDTNSVFSGGLTTPATASSSVGTYTINQGSLAAGSNYTISYTGANLTVNKATLTVTADNQSMTYGGSLPTFTDTITGFANGENATSAGITGSASNALINPIYSTSTTLTAGNYNIQTGSGSLAATNYAFICNSVGTLSVAPKNITLTGISSTNKNYDGTTADILNGTATPSGTVVGDNLTVINGTASFASNTPGTWSVTAAGFALGGNDVGNYALIAQPTLADATIIGATTTIPPQRPGLTPASPVSTIPPRGATAPISPPPVVAANMSALSLGESTFFDGARGIVVASESVSPFAFQLIGKPFKGIDTRPVPGSSGDSLSLLTSFNTETLNNQFEESTSAQKAAILSPAVYYTGQLLSYSQISTDDPAALDTTATSPSSQQEKDKAVKKQKARSNSRNERVSQRRAPARLNNRISSRIGSETSAKID